MVSVSVTVSAETINQFGFRYRYRTETKIVVSVVYYINDLIKVTMDFGLDHSDYIVDYKVHNAAADDDIS